MHYTVNAAIELASLLDREGAFGSRSRLLPTLSRASPNCAVVCESRSPWAKMSPVWRDLVRWWLLEQPTSSSRTLVEGWE